MPAESCRISDVLSVGPPGSRRWNSAPWPRQVFVNDDAGSRAGPARSPVIKRRMGDSGGLGAEVLLRWARAAMTPCDPLQPVDGTLLISRQVVTPEGVVAAAVHIVGERIAGVIPLDALPDLPSRDLGDLVLLPGLVDTHVHVNQPGRTPWEGWATATAAAAAGGVTSLVDMPLNSAPVTTSRAALEAKRRAATDEPLRIDVGYWGGAVPGNAEALSGLTADGALGAKAFLCHSGIDDFPASDTDSLLPALRALGEADTPLLLHAELEREALLDRAALAAFAPDDYRVWLESRPPTFEEQAVVEAIALAARTGARVHVVHLSAASALPLIRRAKDAGLPITVETCPHYLGLTAEEIPRGATIFKCAPPIREAANREALWDGLREGVIDFIVSDHSPCTPDLKHLDTGDFTAAWGGIAGLQLSLPAVWTEAVARGFGVADIARWMSAGPAAFAGLADKGAIAPGRHADLVAFDPSAQWSAGAGDVRFRNKVSPWLDRPLRGRPVATWLRGALIFDDGDDIGAPRGRELQRS